jgi:protocatechuate 3,4-dioxygenase beta subunit
MRADHHDDHDDADHHRGLAGDLSTLLQRRRALQLLGGAGLFAIVGCAAKSADTSTTASTTAGSTSSSAASSSSSSSTAGKTSTTAGGTTATTAGGSTSSGEVIPEETAGPFPGDGSNGPNALKQSGIVRSDITSSFGSSTNVATGVPLQVKLKILESAKSGAALAGAAVYIWHCDQQGRYSMYSQGATNENYLRGVQEAGSDGTVSFATIFPAAYDGRWPHIHFEVYRSLADATGGGKPIATSQLALPEATCNLVYATDGYSQSVTNMKRTSLKTDMVFRDGAELETPAVTGDVTSGLRASLDVIV